jgi:cyclopropane fatty-acyl-phospholipid synthase-like methyltransferase
MQLNKYEKIFLLSPVRSGSTLLYNIIKELFPNIKLNKSHNITLRLNNFYFISLRHPYNSIISWIEFTKQKCGEHEIKNSIKAYIDTTRNYLICDNLLDEKYDNIIVFHYEKFYNNYDYIFDIIEKKFNMKIDGVKKEYIKNKFSMESVK